jgi:hypothetical protein
MSPELDSVPLNLVEISATGRQPKMGAPRQYSLLSREDSVDHAWRRELLPDGASA